MKIADQNMFATPKGWTELQDWIDLHNPEERIHLLTAAMMAWNLAAHITNNLDDDGNEIAKENDDV